MLGQRQGPALEHEDSMDLSLVVGEQILSQRRTEAAPTDDDEVEGSPSQRYAGHRFVEPVAGVAAGNVEGEVGSLSP